MPRADAAQLGGPFAANVVKVLGWANDPAILQANVITVLIAEGLHDLNALVSENPHAAEIKLPLPDESRDGAPTSTRWPRARSPISRSAATCRSRRSASASPA